MIIKKPSGMKPLQGKSDTSVGPGGPSESKHDCLPMLFGGNMKNSVGVKLCISQIIIMLSAMLVLIACGTTHFKDPLTPQEREWLTSHDGDISMALETGYAPFSFVDKNGINSGLATEYIQLIEKKLKFKISKVYFNSLNDILNSAQKKGIDIVNAVTETQDRSRYLLFTKSYIEIPNVIVVRKKQKDSLSIDKMKNMKISLVKGYAITEHVKRKHSDLNVVSVPDDLAALMSVSFNEADAAILDLATASYLVAEKGLTNLRIAGETDYNIKLSIASRNDWPILNRILEKGLLSITDREKELIKNKWFLFGQSTLFKKNEFWTIFVILLVVFLLGLVGIMVWNRSLKRQVEQRTIQLKEELEERNMAEKALEEIKLQLSNAVEMAHLGHWEYDVVDDLFLFNDHFYKVFGTTAEKMGGYSMSSAEYARHFIHPDDRQILEEETRKAIQTDNPHFNRQLEHRMLYADGSIGYISVRFFIQKDINGKTAKTYGVNQDITERKKFENALKKSEAQHRSILQTAMDGFWMADNKGKLLEVNQTYCQMSGYSQDELLNMKIFDLEAVETQADVSMSSHMKRITAIKEDRFESQHRRKNGEIFDVEVSVQYRDEDGGCHICFLRDITGRKQLEAQVRQAQKMESIGNLAGGIAHDFNNLLFPIVGHAEMLMEDLPPGCPERDNVQGILHAGKRGAELVKQILAFSRQHEHQLIPIRVQKVMQEVLKLSRASIPTNIEINADLQAECGLVLADPTQLHQIGMNLITNAYHALEDTDGQISVLVKEVLLETQTTHMTIQPGKYALLAVEDNGVGIPTANLKKIFDPYFTTKEQGKGTGLGLAVVFGIIKKLGGDISVHSEVDKGTIFNVYLPLIPSPETPGPGAEEVSVTGGTERILLVDDEVDIAHLEKQVLERLGYKVSQRTSSADALEAFRNRPDFYDLVITDMSMPNMTGEQLARELIAIRPDISVIICTGFSERINKEKAEKSGIKGFLMKPVIKSDMAAMVRRVLDGHSV